MKKVAITGTWRTTNKQMEEDVKKVVENIINSGNSIVAGGALGVDFIATNEALRLNPGAGQITIFLPATLEIYSKHYFKRAEEGVITKEQAELLITQLKTIKTANAKSIIENPINNIVDQTAYYERIKDIVNYSDEVIAFQLNDSKGTQYTIDIAEQKGIPVKVFKYTIS
ncbi:hypothetical protein A3F07_01570 [candidate division WWE3 bacterium RIFCSPHIGHO2_12_FULL_38_15]|uniref:Smf/DprA SLOG domain-containing protein n=1 Tax=candidate division WWE3 bacterium RIFCSPHIGHO2_02_FULL_38_14 TaxID=1802620 RepID=A0A1F4V9R4_UNCKA|nr:MAG: hypothetical protein A2793_01730 [candidate division WWE3 bacterium RIFCSPHIGHO2_01_FULL_38_45]OGC48394.1 MAG: hypothetical protein A3F07_01570 [candidate division WWE3 bacterium RIFCSPHIGHO2_12_FULL_38_15]OGC53630.1 MAG: hypothetical protein A3D91_04285 [candidate division WWE3 bacterium RIFCSPHIGHO2_02_FULL_38_14]OGC54328.1 MAG: hypothetical protein A3B64_02365 [candidate division WWE3 bacterium RIFCSPLOWO2_01_FULL_37_24]HLB51572.1 DNA-processing protein DprA [Patescibacteria group ba